MPQDVAMMLGTYLWAMWMLFFVPVAFVWWAYKLVFK